MAVADRHGLPVAIGVESATPHEVKLATNTLVQMVIPDAPQNLVGDNAYDSDKLDTHWKQRDFCTILAVTEITRPCFRQKHCSRHIPGTSYI